jgi:hypothetical protein
MAITLFGNLKRESFMRIAKAFCGIALLPLLASAALAEQPKHSSTILTKQLVLSDQQKNARPKKPMLLNEKQMDGVTAGMMLGLPSGAIIYLGRLPSDPVLWPNGVPSCHTGPACL